jgi:striatin 1/3/4
MRFLQTEWHRHERDRNAWEIERQEMRARIASLEGAGRRNQLTQNGQKKYIKLLETALKEERKKAKAGTEADPAKEVVKDTKESKASTTKTRRRLFSGHDGCHLTLCAAKDRPHNSFLDVESDAAKAMDVEGNALRPFLDSANQEFTYLMVSAANPGPPRDPPQQPNIEDYAQGYAPQYMEDFQPQARQKDIRQPIQTRPTQLLNHQPPPVQASNIAIRASEPQTTPMVRSAPEQQPLPQSFATGSGSFSEPPEAPMEEEVTKISHSYDDSGRLIESKESKPAEKTGADAEDGWDFTEPVQFTDSETKPAPQRPDTDVFPNANDLPKSPSKGPASHRRKGSMSRRRSGEHDMSIGSGAQAKADGNFKVRFGLRGHLDAVRTVIFTGGGSPGEPEICTAGDDGTIKRWIIPARYETAGMHNGSANDLDIQSFFTHRGHTGAVMCLASWSPTQNLSSGGRAQGDGWVFSGGQDASVRVWERGRVDPKATLDGHTDAVWALCVLPATCGTVFGQNNNYGGSDRILLVSGAADGTVRVWSVSPPPQLMSPQGGSGSRRAGGGRVRGNSVSSGTSFPASGQPSLSAASPFHHTLIHTLKRENSDASPTSITPLSTSGETFVVAYSDAAVLVYDTRTGEEISAMASLETYDGTIASGVNAIVATTAGLDGSLSFDSSRSLSEDEGVVHGATGSSGGVEGIIITGHEDRFIRFFDANSGIYLSPIKDNKN